MVIEPAQTCNSGYIKAQADSALVSVSRFTAHRPAIVIAPVMAASYIEWAIVPDPESQQLERTTYREEHLKADGKILDLLCAPTTSRAFGVLTGRILGLCQKHALQLILSIPSQARLVALVYQNFQRVMCLPTAGSAK